MKDPVLREPLFHCNASASGKRYFHQSCLGREQAGALSYDNKYFHVRGATADKQHEELRNISHKLCGDCLSSAQTTAPDEHRLQRLKYEGVIGLFSVHVLSCFGQRKVILFHFYAFSFELSRAFMFVLHAQMKKRPP